MTLALAILLSHASLPDARYLTRAADSAGVPALAVMAIAWEESRGNVDPRLRGTRGEIGRFEIMPATAAAFCPDLDVTRYKYNVVCALRLLRLDLLRVGLVRAIIRHNGRAEGPRAKAYADRVLTTIERWTLEEATK